jgi:hypothetical protein
MCHDDIFQSYISYFLKVDSYLHHRYPHRSENTTTTMTKPPDSPSTPTFRSFASGNRMNPRLPPPRWEGPTRRRSLCYTGASPRDPPRGGNRQTRRVSFRQSGQSLSLRHSNPNVTHIVTRTWRSHPRHGHTTWTWHKVQHAPHGRTPAPHWKHGRALHTNVASLSLYMKTQS